MMANKFQTFKEIEEYYRGNRIQCLECGKWYKELGWHLKSKHKISCDEYKKAFGLPWSRGLVSEELHLRKSKTAKKLVREKKIAQHFDSDDFSKKRSLVTRKPNQPFMTVFLREHGKKLMGKYRIPSPPGRERLWFKEHFEKYLIELKTTKKTILEVYERGKWPHPNMLYRYAKQNPEFGERLKAVSNYKGCIG